MAKRFDMANPDKDAGWGLIFRLNDLWAKADVVSLRADYELWQLVIDKIFSNLCYRNPIEEIKDEEGNIIDVKISDHDLIGQNIMKRKIKIAKGKLNEAIKKRNVSLINDARDNYYNAIYHYEIWTRKFMQKHQLYLKETESNPSTALFGGAFK